MNGIDNLLYMSSASDSSGRVEITLTFSADADPDIAQVQVQNKLQLATPLLPQEVQRQGISVTKRAANFLKVYAFVSEDNSMDNADIGDYIATNIQDQISRLPGVGEVIPVRQPSTACASGWIPTSSSSTSLCRAT